MKFIEYLALYQKKKYELEEYVKEASDHFHDNLIEDGIMYSEKVKKLYFEIAQMESNEVLENEGN